MNEVTPLLIAERELEHRIAAGATNEIADDGWTTSLMFFHLAQWRGRLLAALSDAAKQVPHSAPPGNIDDFNDAELPAGKGVSLADAAERSDVALGSLIKTWNLLGERPFIWYGATTTSEALTRNSYLHPRIHLAAYLTERGRRKEADRLVEETATELRAADAAPRILGVALYNLASVRVTQGRNDEAIALLEEAAPMSPDLGSYAINDAVFEPLRVSPRFGDLGKTGDGGQPR